ncbi:ShlB/FhaC/HecB family hemolysin secretion/activation protein [Telmatospirillum siberiense]|nr:ShlB/FhaC/HecB family hemolysin secretion/activation protein [Telmatospirillum siberiense]
MASASSRGAFAQAAGDQRAIERQQDQIQQLQQQRFDQRGRDRRLSEPPPEPLPVPPAGPSELSPSAVCFTLRRIVFEGATLLSEDDRQDLSAGYPGRCVSFAEVNEILRAVTDLYAARGYVTTRATLPQQNVADGILTIRVVEGRLQGFDWNGEPASDLSEVLAAFPAAPGEVLNLRDLEQGIDQLNRLRSNDARIELIPGDRPGDSRVAITDKPSKTWRVTGGVDNSGQRTTGELQTKASAEIEDLLGVNDSFAIFHSQDLLGNSSQRSSRSWAINGSVPRGYWRFNGAVDFMQYRSMIYGLNQIIQSAGTQRAVNLGLDRMLWRDDVGKTFASFTLSYKSVVNDVAGVVVAGSSPKLVIAGGGLDDVRRLLDGVLHSNLQYAGGLHALGAREDGGWAGSPKAQFTVWRGDLSYAHPIEVAGLPRLTLSSGAHGQWTTDALYSTEQVALGGESTVRGYKDQILQGNRGGNLHTELSAELPSGFAAIDETLGVIRPFAAYDVGVVSHFHPDNSVGGRLSGAAVGVRLGGPWLEGELTCAWPLAHPASIETPPHQLTFSLVLVL